MQKSRFSHDVTHFGLSRYIEDDTMAALVGGLKLDLIYVYYTFISITRIVVYM